MRAAAAAAGSPRARVLIVAPTCDGTDVGESWSSFQWVSWLSHRFDVTLLTYSKRDRDRVGEQLPRAKVIEWRDLPVVGRFERFNSGAKPGYVAFYLRARRWLRRADAARNFDLIHQLSPLALRYPSPAAGLGLPLVVGPLAGSLPTPPGFRDEMRGASWFTKLRAIDGWRLRHDPLLRRTYESADVVLGVAPYVRELLSDLSIKRFEVMSETGIESLPPAAPPARRTDGPMRLLFVGRVVRSKGVRDGIRALAHLADLPCQLDVVGDGDDLPACRAEAERLGVSGRVRFHGRLPRTKLDSFYAGADVMLFPSIREPSGNAVLEAMCHGLPMVVADYGGPAEAVSDACGVRVKPTTPDVYARDLADAVRRIIRDPARLAAMGRASRQRIADTFLWEKKAAWVADLYRQVLGAARTPARHAGDLPAPHPLAGVGAEHDVPSTNGAL